MDKVQKDTISAINYPMEHGHVFQIEKDVFLTFETPEDSYQVTLGSNPKCQCGHSDCKHIETVINSPDVD